MKKNHFFRVTLALIFFGVTACVKDVKDALDDASLSLKCLERVQDFEEANNANPDRSCSEIIADIDDIERTCDEFLSSSTKEQFQELRDACAAGS